MCFLNFWFEADLDALMSRISDLNLFVDSGLLKNQNLENVAMTKNIIPCHSP
jgi:hypothetical protein